MFKKEQIDFMHKIGLKIDFSKPLSEEDFEMIEDKVSFYLQKHGFDKDYNTNKTGRMCESILDAF